MAPPSYLRPSSSALVPARAAAFVLLLLLALAMIASPARDVRGAGPATIAVDMDPGTPGIQTSLTLPLDTSEFSVDIVVLNATSLGAFEFWIHFDNIALSYQGWTEGAFLGSTGRPTQCFQIINETSLRIGCATSGLPPPDGPSGDGVLGTLRFKPRFPVFDACFPLLLVETADPYGTPWPTGDQGGCVTILPRTPTPTATPTETPTSTPTPSPTNTPLPSLTPARTTTRTVVPQRTTTVTPQRTALATVQASPSAPISPVPTHTKTPAAGPATVTKTAVVTTTSTVSAATASPVPTYTRTPQASSASGASGASSLPRTGNGRAGATSNLALAISFIGMVLVVVAIRLTLLSDDAD